MHRESREDQPRAILKGQERQEQKPVIARMLADGQAEEKIIRQLVAADWPDAEASKFVYDLKSRMVELINSKEDAAQFSGLCLLGAVGSALFLWWYFNRVFGQIESRAGFIVVPGPRLMLAGVLAPAVCLYYALRAAWEWLKCARLLRSEGFHRS